MGLVQHINQAQRCACVFEFSLAPGLDWVRPEEKGGGGRGAEQDCAHPQLMIGPTVL